MFRQAIWDRIPFLIDIDNMEYIHYYRKENTNKAHIWGIRSRNRNSVTWMVELVWKTLLYFRSGYL